MQIDPSMVTFTENKTYVAKEPSAMFRLERDRNSCHFENKEKNYHGKLNYYNSNSFLIQSGGCLDRPHLGKYGESNQLIIIKAGTL